jgi:hypothetical protein
MTMRWYWAQPVEEARQREDLNRMSIYADVLGTLGTTLSLRRPGIEKFNADRWVPFDDTPIGRQKDGAYVTLAMLKDEPEVAYLVVLDPHQIYSPTHQNWVDSFTLRSATEVNLGSRDRPRRLFSTEELLLELESSATISEGE